MEEPGQLERVDGLGLFDGACVVVADTVDVVGVDGGGHGHTQEGPFGVGVFVEFGRVPHLGVGFAQPDPVVGSVDPGEVTETGAGDRDSVPVGGSGLGVVGITEVSPDSITEIPHL